MPLAIRYRHDPAPVLAPGPDLTVSREVDPFFMAALQGRSVVEIARRFADGHRAYVARCDGEPAAWGWVATTSASIGELGAAVVLPRGDRYLWNFVTLAAYRGRGIYPRLLDAMVHAECSMPGEDGDQAGRFWIVYAPENHASGAGLRKAGFLEVADLSFDSDGRAALRVLSGGTAAAATRVFQLPQANEPLAPCWRCTRAGRHGMSCSFGECECDYQRPDAGCAA